MNINPLSVDHSLNEITLPGFRRLAFYLIRPLVKEEDLNLPDLHLNVLATLHKQVKINEDKIERRFGVVMTPFSTSK